MNRKLFTYFLLACVLVWLILSYAPGLQQQLPVIGFTDAWRAPLLWLGGLAVALFLSIQAWVVGSTVVALRRRNTMVKSDQPDLETRLSLAKELFWTALPILMTVLLAFAGYRIWEAR